MDKAPDAYRTISEVADDLDLPQHVLRFWETRFAQIKPLKRGGGRRYYRPEDIDLLKGIRHLLYGEGYTIRGVQRIIKESGVKAIQALGRGEGAAAVAKPGGPEVVSAAEEEARGLRAGLRGLVSSLRGEPGEPDESAPEPDRREPAARIEPRFAPEAEPASAEEPAAEPQAAAPAPAPPPRAAEPPPSVLAELPPPAPPRPNGEAPPAPAAGRPAMAADDIRLLQAALYELSECRRRLDQAYEGR